MKIFYVITDKLRQGLSQDFRAYHPQAKFSAKILMRVPYVSLSYRKTLSSVPFPLKFSILVESLSDYNIFLLISRVLDLLDH